MKTNFRLGMLQTIYQGESIYKEIEAPELDAEGLPVLDDDGNEVMATFQIEEHKPIVCSDPLCGRHVQHGQVCFVDTWSDVGDIYCDDCGKCFRYSRKMAKRRGEDPKSVLAEDGLV